MTDALGQTTAHAYDTRNNLLSMTDALGLYFKRARYYSHDRGRFMTMDPYAGRPDEPATLHKYVFGHADPVNRIDPCGTTAALEYGTLSRQVALQAAAEAAILGIRISCMFYRAASVIDQDIIPMIPPLFRGCAITLRDEEVDCEEVKKICIENCAEEVLGGRRDKSGDPFWLCLTRCMESYGCPKEVRYW